MSFLCAQDEVSLSVCPPPFEVILSPCRPFSCAALFCFVFT